MGSVSDQELLGSLQKAMREADISPAQALHQFVTDHRMRPSDVERLIALVTNAASKDVRQPCTPAAPPTALAVADRPSIDEDEVVAPRAMVLAVEYDEFGLVSSGASHSAASLRTGGVVDDAVADLMDDWQRQGELRLVDIHRVCARRGLGVEDTVEVIVRLEDLGAYEEAAGPARVNVEQRERGDGSDSDGLRVYFHEVARYALIGAQREVELGRRIRSGQQAAAALSEARSLTSEQLPRLVADGRMAHSELVCANLRLAINIARRHFSSNVELLDRIQFGNLGLMRAADKFDYSLGYKFSTYATWWIRQSISRGVADTARMIRLPVHMVEKINRFHSVERKLCAERGRDVTVIELAAELGEDSGTVASILDIDRSVASLDAPVGGEDEATLGDLISETYLDLDPADVVVDAIMRDEFTDALFLLLTERQRVVIERRYGFGSYDAETLDEIGARLGVTRERVRQIQNRAMSQLEAASQMYEFREHYGPAAHSLPTVSPVEPLPTVLPVAPLPAVSSVGALPSASPVDVYTALQAMTDHRLLQSSAAAAPGQGSDVA